MANDSIGEEVEKSIAALPNGGVVLLENVRFYKEEEKNDPEFAKKLASLADLYVNDAFGTAHRAHASTEGVTKFLKPSVAGFLMQKVFISLCQETCNVKLKCEHYLWNISVTFFPFLQMVLGTFWFKIIHLVDTYNLNFFIQLLCVP